MINIASTDELVLGNVYMVEMSNGEVNSYRVITETPTHYILSCTIGDQIEVKEIARVDILGIYDVKEWLKEKVE